MLKGEQIRHGGLPLGLIDPDKLRNLGNEFFQAGDYWNAVSHYTKSLARAAAGSELRGLAYANRSAVLLCLGYYDECISDAKFALQNNYPDNLAYKLHLRMATCYKAQGQQTEAEVHMQAVMRLFEDQQMESAAFERIKGQFAERHQPKLPRIRVEYLEPPPLCCGPHPQDSSISSALDIKLIGQKLSLVANRNINTGDVLLIEEPKLVVNHCHMNGGDPSWIHCSRCLKVCVNLQPCQTCSQALYCSETCVSEAWENYHKNECMVKKEIVEKLISGKINTSHPVGFIAAVNYSFAMISKYGLETCINYFVENADHSSTPQELRDLMQIEGCEMGDLAYGEPFQAGIRRVTKSKSLGLSSAQKPALFKFLVKSAKILFGGHINRHLMLTEMSLVGGELCADPSGLINIAFGIYPKTSRLISTCDSNTFCHYYQKTLVLRASRPISVGENVSITTRGMKYSVAPLEERKAVYCSLFGRSFRCHCRACIEDWPESKNLTTCHEFVTCNDKFKRFLCPKFEANIRQPMHLFRGKLHLSKLSPENLTLCQQIQQLYVDQRKDDQQYNNVSDFLYIYFHVHVKKYLKESGTNAKPKQLDHFIPCKVF
ncbi:SET and MYND domain-containing protein 4-like [Neocloeon triangulifer]|uniref:SET and MYND domain-containing protein 4-like n=1 Tax=Neocloeon triangulifer TaxID=2078957 RepID=UPI00286F22B4|nr:SET and MYND domain-containing protein 4-like [Neocloeon triangulifer]